jgi:hypothetical protein
VNELPSSISWFIRQLERSGFELTDDETSEAFGNRLMTFRREPVEIRVIRDRGQWTADLMATDWSGDERLAFPVLEGRLPPPE